VVGDQSALSKVLTDSARVTSRARFEALRGVVGDQSALSKALTSRARAEALGGAIGQRSALSKALEGIEATPPAPPASPLPPFKDIRPLPQPPLRIDFGELEEIERRRRAEQSQEARARHEALVGVLLQMVSVQEEQLAEARRMQERAEADARQAHADRLAESRRHQALEAKRDKRERVLLATAISSPVLSVFAIVVSVVA
jgi:hypothetical protein